jgi:hypothetical protein
MAGKGYCRRCKRGDGGGGNDGETRHEVQAWPVRQPARSPTRLEEHNDACPLEALLEGEGEALTRTAIDLAKGGDVTALRLCLDRLLPPRKDRHVPFALPALETAGDAVKATAALVEAVAAGRLTPSEAGELAKLVDGFARAAELHDIQQRLEKLEATQPGTGR